MRQPARVIRAVAGQAPVVDAGALGDLAGFGLGNVSVVTAIGGATTLTCNVLLAKYWNKEALVRTDLFGVAFVLTGAVVIAGNKPKKTKQPKVGSYKVTSSKP